MLAKIAASNEELSPDGLGGISHLLVVLQKGKRLPGAFPGKSALEAMLARRKMQAAELDGNPLSAELGQGGLAAWVMLDDEQSVFQRQSAMRNALQLLLNEHPQTLHIAVVGTPSQRPLAAEVALYTALVNGKPLPSRKKKSDGKPLQRIVLHGYADKASISRIAAVAEGNYLARMLTVLPPNELTPGTYRKRIAALAKLNGWKLEEFNFKRLAKMGAGAFVAVAQGSPQKDAAIVHLQYRHGQAKQTVALVGKGICFDTGGHNLKPARGMLGMHEDMNGSAVALGILLAATRLKLRVNIDCWLAIAQNHLSPAAYKQNDVVTALNGTTIEIVHTDAEGRMVLSDALTLAARLKPDLMVDFATLTGTMIAALGTRYSGIFSNRESLLVQAVRAGRITGERVNPFPLDPDYDAALKSEVADTKQCIIAGEADNILAARFLDKFVDDLPWIHVDLAAANCENGLGAVAGPTTGFGVAWGVEMLRRTIGYK